MSDITMSTSDLVRLLDSIAYPNPEEWGPVGPAGPVSGRWEWSWLNPQPLPPKYLRSATRVWGPFPEPWGPQPEPWRWAQVTQATISRALDSFEAAGIIIVGGDTEHAAEKIRASIAQLVDEICGTPPRKGPFPGPWGPLLDPETLHPSNLVVAGAQFQKAADALGDHELTGVLRDSAARLFDTGLSRLRER